MTEREDLEKVVDRVRKLLSLASKNTNEAEATSAAAKAQELLAAYNLDMSTIEQGDGSSGKREDARVRGGMYLYERTLWNEIADLNFCVYFTTREFKEVRLASGLLRNKVTFRHRVVGRVVNTTATRMMADYLQGTIERLCRERFPVNSQFFTREAVAFREGMAARLGERLRERRSEKLAAEEAEAEKRNEAARRAARAGASASTALTLADVRTSEEAANYDFMHGEGAWAKQKAREAKWDADWDKKMAARAKAAAEAEAAYAQWAADHPEEAAKEEKKRLAAERKAAQCEANRRPRYRQATAQERREGSAHYWQGYDKGDKVSIDPQVDGSRGETRRIGR